MLDLMVPNIFKKGFKEVDLNNKEHTQYIFSIHNKATGRQLILRLSCSMTDPGGKCSEH